MIRTMLDYLNRQVSPSSVILFRMAFGGILFWEVIRYFDHGWIARYWMRPDFYFTYTGFSWLEPLPDQGMIYLFYIMGAAALGVCSGFLYRYSASLLFLGFTYIFLLDKTNYLNHFYLISLISFLMIWLPVNRIASLDVKLGLVKRVSTVPLWTPLLLGFQIGIAYFYGGVAKINGDWLRGFPLFEWLGQQPDFPILGRFFDEVWMIYFFSYSGLLLDLLIVPTLLWKRTRYLAFAGIMAFHLLNHSLWQIGIFPWFMMAATTIYFPPDWLEKLLARFKWYPFGETSESDNSRSGLLKPVTLGLLSIFVFFQVMIPLRHFVLPGNVSWNELGHRFAWHMKLRDKSANAIFIIHDRETGERWEVDNSDYLSSRQRRKMPSRPDMILQFAHYLGEVHWEDGYRNVAVYAEVEASLNGRAYQALIKPDVNLLRITRGSDINDWVVPLEQPLFSGANLKWQTPGE